jgi:hypothetical protein
LSTFIARELIPHEDFVSLAVVANAMTLKRPDLKKKVCALLSAVTTWGFGNVVIGDLRHGGLME